MAIKTAYVTDQHGIYTGESFRFTTRRGRKPNWVTTEPPEIPDGKMAQWRGHVWVLVDQVPPSDLVRERKRKTPREITLRQAKQQLAALDLTGNVEAAIDAVEDAQERENLRIYWEDSQVFRRKHPELNRIGAAIGLTEEDLDNFFIEASTR